MKKHIKLIVSTTVASALLLSVSTSVLATSTPAPITPTRPGITTPATPTAPAPSTPAPITPARPAVPSARPQPAPGTTTPTKPATPTPGAAHYGHGYNHANHHAMHGFTFSGKIGGSVLLNIVEYYENLAEHGVISQDTATKAIDYMLNRYTGVSNNYGQIASENKASSIKFEHRANGGATFIQQKPDGKVIFFEQTPGKGAVYHEHNAHSSVDALNSAIVHSLMVNEGIISKQEAHAISNFETKSGKSAKHHGARHHGEYK